MGSPKRERQKANRQQRLIEEARADRTDRVRRNVLRWGIAIVAAILAVVAIAWIGGAFSGDDDTPVTLPPVTTDPTATTEPAPSTTVAPAPDKPDVELPEAEPTELEVTTLTAGEGPAAAEGDTVAVYYVGVLSSDGTEFDENYTDGLLFPVTIGETAVIEGWTQGLVGAQAGERRQIDIPGELAYGSAGRGEIPPDAALTFVIDVVSVTPGS